MATLVEWGGLTLGGPASNYRITGITGWDELPASRVEDTPRANQHGSFDTPVWSEARTVVVEGYCYDQRARAQLLAELGGVMVYPNDGPSSELAVTFAGRRLTAQARLMAYGPILEAGPWGGGYFGWQAQWRCADPYRYGQRESAATALPANLGGLAFPLFNPTPDGAALSGNSDFETGVTGWTSASFGASTFTQSFDQVHHGAASGLITPDGESTFPAVFNDASTAASVTEGGFYAASAWVYSPQGYDDVRIRLDWRDATDSIFDNTTPASHNVPAGVWTRIRTTGTAPAGAVQGGVRIIMGRAPASIDFLYVDEAAVSVPGFALWFGDVGATGRVQLRNDGTAPAWPVFDVTGPLEQGFELVETSMSRRIAYAAAIPEGQTVTVDTAAGTSTLQGGADRSGELTRRNWWSVPPGGSREVLFTPGNGASNPDALLVARITPTYW